MHRTASVLTASAFDTRRRRQARWIGILLAVMIAMVFIFPARAYPLQGMMLAGLFLLVAISLLGLGMIFDREGVIRRLGGMGAVALALFTLWSLWRWQGLEVPALDDPGAVVKITQHGRPIVIGDLLWIVAFAAGLGLASLGERTAPLAFSAMRKTFFAVAILFSVFAMYQYAIGYDRSLAEFRASSSTSAMDPLIRQSIEHALKEKRIGGRLGNANVFAAWLAVLAGFSLSVLGRNSPWRLKAFGGAAYLLAAGTIVLTRSRGGLLTLFLVTIWGLLLLRFGKGLDRDAGEASGKPPDNSSSPNKRRKRPNRRSTAASAILLFGFALASFASRAMAAGGVWDRLTNISTIRERFFYWRVALSVWSTNWLAGASPGGFALYYPRFRPAGAHESRFAHSWFFQTGAETGAVGLALLLLFWLALAWAACRAWRRSAGDPGPGVEAAREANWLALGCGALVFNGLFEYSLQMREFLMLLGLMGGGLIGLAWSRGADEAGRTFGISTIMKTRAAVACVAFLICFGAAAWMVPREALATQWEWEGKFMAQRGRHAEAADDYRRASRWLPDHSGYVANQASALSQIPQRRVEAEQLLNRAARMNPLSARTRSAQADLYKNLGQPDRALAKLGEAIDLYPHNAGYRVRRARMNLDAGNREAARDDMDFITGHGLPLEEFQQPLFDRLEKALKNKTDLP